MNRFSALTCVLAAVLATASIKPYRIDVQQGNLVTPKEVATLKRGMTKREVRYLLGTPLVVDPFHTDRWDYFYSLRKGRSNDIKRRRVTLLFDGEQLTRIEGDVVAGLDASLTASEETGGTVVTDPPEQKKKSLLRRTWEKVWGAGTDEQETF